VSCGGFWVGWLGREVLDVAFRQRQTPRGWKKRQSEDESEAKEDGRNKTKERRRSLRYSGLR
jgi:hypothetical protein